MKTIWITFALFVMGLPALAQSQGAIGGAGAEGKLASLNTASFRTGIRELKVKVDSLNAEFETKRKVIEALESEVNNLKTRIQTQGNTVSQEVRNLWVEEGSEKERKLKRLAEEYAADSQRRLAEVTGPIMAKIGKFLEEYCKQQGIIMVLEGRAAQQAGIVVFASPASDITEDFMAQYNKAHPESRGSSALSKKPRR